MTAVEALVFIAAAAGMFVVAWFQLHLLWIFALVNVCIVVLFPSPYSYGAIALNYVVYRLFRRMQRSERRQHAMWLDNQQRAARFLQDSD